MTSEELETLPINPTDFSVEMEMRDGQLVSIPRPPTRAVLFHREKDFACIYDKNGIPWKTGLGPGGRLMRERLPQ